MFNIAELFGYIASFFVAISLVMSSFLWLRVLNLIGAVSFVIYGSMLGSIPVVITNSFITIIDIYYLIQMFRPDLNGVSYVPIGPEKRGQLDDFVAHYLDDVLRFFPDFSIARIDECFDAGGQAFLAMKDLRLVGFTLVYPVPLPERADSEELRKLYSYVHSELFPDRSAIVPVDYIIKKYRGLGLVHRLYRTIEKEASFSFLLAPVRKGEERHRRFLKQHGFTLKKELPGYELFAMAMETPLR